MIYLLAKYTLLFLLATAMGFILGYWFSRRNFEDVSESFEDLRKANDRSDMANWKRLFGELKNIPEPKETDLSGVNERLNVVAAAVSRLPKPEPVDFSSVETSLDSLSAAVGAIPAPPKPQEFDVQPLIEKLSNIEGEIKAIPVAEKPAAVDLSAVTGKLDALQMAVRSIPEPEPQRDVDLEPIDQRLTGIETKLRSLGEQQRDVDLEPIDQRLTGIETKLRSLGEQNRDVDLQPIDQRLTGIETELKSLGKRVARPVAAERAPRPERREEPRILSAALYGKKDNLRLISGVGPKLEDLLNKNGVYYFWQVAEWNERDIDVIDERLDVFKGRIGRDDWVGQANRLRRDASAARMPAEL